MPSDDAPHLLDDSTLDALRRAPEEDPAGATTAPGSTVFALKAFREAARDALRARLAHDPDPLCATRLYVPAGRFRSKAAAHSSDCRTALDVCDTACLLLAGGLISVATIRQAIDTCPHRLLPAFLQRALVYRLLADGDLPAAREAADSPHFGDEQWVGWRAIGEHHALQADAAGFLSLWSRYGARHERDWMDGMRIDLVEAVSRARGWREALALSRHKHVGNPKAHVHGLAFIALRPLAQHTPVQDLDHLLATAPELATLETLDTLARLQLLVDALHASTPRAPDRDPPALDGVLARLIAVDPSVSKQQSQRRDWLLTACWPLIGDAATLKRVRAAIRAPVYRRGLSALARDSARLEAGDDPAGAP